MENSTNPKGAKKSEAPKRPQRPATSQSSEPVGPPTEQPKKLARYFKKTTYIKGFGIVNAGDKLTGEMAKAWAANTAVKIDDYVGKASETLVELPQTDKEKLAAYEALTKK